MVMTRLAMPGDTITQEHMYVKRSPRLMYALPDDDPGAPLLPPTPRPALPCPASPVPIVRAALSPLRAVRAPRVRSPEPCEDHEPRRPSTVASFISGCHIQTLRAEE